MLEATAAGGEVVLGVEELDADSVSEGPSPGAGPSPLGPTSVEAVVQIGQLAVAQTV